MILVSWPSRCLAIEDEDIELTTLLLGRVLLGINIGVVDNKISLVWQVCGLVVVNTWRSLVRLGSTIFTFAVGRQDWAIARYKKVDMLSVVRYTAEYIYIKRMDNKYSDPKVNGIPRS
jgi:hypothetical protein